MKESKEHLYTMNSTEVLSAGNAEQVLSTPEKEVRKKRIPLKPYVPPHRRNQTSTNHDLEHCDYKDTNDEFPKIRKITLSNSLSGNSSLVHSTSDTFSIYGSSSSIYSSSSNVTNIFSIYEPQHSKPLNELSEKIYHTSNFNNNNNDENKHFTSTNHTKLTSKESNLEHCNHINSVNKIPKTKKTSLSTNTLSDDNSSVYSTISSNLNGLSRKTLQTSTQNNNEHNIPFTESISDTHDSGSEGSFCTYNTASDLTSDSIIYRDENKNESINIESLRKEDTFASNIKPTNQSLPEVYDKINNLSINISKDTIKSKSILEHQNENNQSINGLNTTKKTDYHKKGDNGLVIQQILDLANVYLNTTFKIKLSELYSKKYSECIPLHLLQEISFLVAVDEKSPKTEHISPTDSEVTKDKSLFSIGNIKPKLLTLRDIGSTYSVRIFSCKSITEIWGKVMCSNNLEKLAKLSNKMKNFYNSEKLIASNIKEGDFYVVYKDDMWHRVKCLKYSESAVLVLFIDQGDEFIFPVTDIYELYDQFALLPAQAIKMSLSDLQVFSDCDEAFIILKNMLLKKIFYATSTNFPYQHENNCWNVKLYMNIYEENINIAELVIDQLMKTFLNPKFNLETDEIIPVHVSFINDKRIFVQLIESKSHRYFMKLFRDIIIKYLDTADFKRHKVQLSENSIYLVQNPKIKTWYRAKILKLKGEEQVEALLIDTGMKIYINKEEFIPIEKFSSILAKYPQQAIEVQVHELSNFYEHQTLVQFRKLLQNTNSFFALFITKTLENNIPTIRLFRKESDNSLTPINDTLFLKKLQIESKTIVPVNETKVLNDILTLQSQKMSRMRELQRSLSLASLSTVLDAPQVPKDFCDAHVVLADNPFKFVIQFLSSKQCELKKLIDELSNVCNSYKGPQLGVQSVKIGQLYATKYDEYDYKWYRVYLLEVSPETKTATVYYCDYGYYKEVRIEDILPLEMQFHQLPYQAVWAELYGIKPAFGMWTVDDASRFKDLTQLKNFVCLIKSKKTFKPKNYEPSVPITVETVYSLELVDTTTAEDIYIADILVNERRALKV